MKPIHVDSPVEITVTMDQATITERSKSRKTWATKSFARMLEEQPFRGEIQKACTLYPDVRSLHLEYSDIDRFDQELAEYLVAAPNNALQAVRDGIAQMMGKHTYRELNIRIHGIPPANHVPPGALRSKHLGTLVAVEGIVSRATEVKHKLTTGIFECQKCLQILHVPQRGQTYREPLECFADQGGCSRTTASTSFILKVEQAAFVDVRKILIQEPPERSRGGAMPSALPGVLLDDLVDEKVRPGARVRVVGIYRSMVKEGPVKSNIFEEFLEVVSIEIEEEPFDLIEPSPEEIERIHRVALDPDLYEKIVESMCPDVLGLEEEKLALALQLFGGVSRVDLEDGIESIRGDPHILLVGDPSVAKSTMLRWMHKLWPLAVYSSGAGGASSAAGLTAAAVKDSFGEGRWTLEAGTVVLAHRSLAIVDELDKMGPNDRESLHVPMEQQFVPIAKAGITANIPSVFGLLAAANPKLGRFDDWKSIFDQVDLPTTLWSRFDLIIIMRDRPNPKKDRAIMRHILSRRRAAVSGKTLPGKEPPFSMDFLRKYVAWAKRNVNPVLSMEALQLIEDEYEGARTINAKRELPVPVTIRQGEATLRLAEASARMRLSSVVQESDVMRARDLQAEFTSRIVGSKDQTFWDADRAEGRTSHDARKNMDQVVGILRDLHLNSGRPVPVGVIFLEADKRGIASSVVEEVLGKAVVFAQARQTDKGLWISLEEGTQ